MTKYNKDNVKNITKELLTQIGEDPEREGLLNTPDRVSRAWEYLSRGYRPSAIWYSQDAATTFDTIFEGANKSNYGCVFEQNSNSWGPILDTTNGDTNITIYIGFNNDVSLG